jgi:hypothetical protein
LNARPLALHTNGQSTKPPAFFILQVYDGLARQTAQATVGLGKESQAGYTLLSDEPLVVEDLESDKRFLGTTAPDCAG